MGTIHLDFSQCNVQRCLQSLSSTTATQFDESRSSWNDLLASPLDGHLLDWLTNLAAAHTQNLLSAASVELPGLSGGGVPSFSALSQDHAAVGGTPFGAKQFQTSGSDLSLLDELAAANSVAGEGEGGSEAAGTARLSAAPGPGGVTSSATTGGSARRVKPPRVGPPPARIVRSGGSTSLLSGGACAVRDLSGFTANTLGPTDDGSTGLVSLGFVVNFFGQEYTQLFVNNNGNVTFDVPWSEYTPPPFNTITHPMIAPFFADVDTFHAASGVVTYGQETIDGRPAFGVNWFDVGYYDQHVDKTNKFQLVLIGRADIAPGAFDVEFNYCRVEWETGDFSGGLNGLGGESARVGFTSGSQVFGADHELVGSGVNSALLDSNPGTGLIHHSVNSPQLGRYRYEFRDGHFITVTVEATDAIASETGGNTGQFTVTRTGDSTRNLMVSFGVGGTAFEGEDYAALPLYVTIPAGLNSTTLTVTPMDDAFAEGTETVRLTLLPVPSYQVGSQASATVTIADDATDLPMVTIATSNLFAFETETYPGKFTLVRAGPTTASLTVYYTISGTAQ